MSDDAALLTWVVLTMGDRPSQLSAAVRSLLDTSDDRTRVLVVSNGAGSLDLPVEPRLRTIELDENLGVPGGRDAGARVANSEFVGFLDDDAVAAPGISDVVIDAFLRDDRLGAVALRIVDEAGVTARRHTPRAGRRGVADGGDVALFLGGASAVRADAYRSAGGYFVQLFYGHEEVEICWRLTDRGWSIRYFATATVQHPRTEIGRHPRGWELTGRNRVWIARRTLPWPVAVVHVSVWLVLGLRRAPPGECRHSYFRGWCAGWRGRIDRRPIRWTTVWRLARLGRPPVF